MRSDIAAGVDRMHGRSALFGPVGAQLARCASARVIIPLAALVGLALLLSAGAVHLASQRQDLLQREGEANAIRFSLRQLGRALAAEARDYAWWDDAVRHLAITPDLAWADANIGSYIQESFGYEVSVVLTGDGQPVYGQVDGRRDTTGATSRLGPELATLVARAAAHRAGDEPKPVQAVLSGPEGLFAVAASPIVPMSGSELEPPSGPPSVLVFGKRLDEAFLHGLEQDFGIGHPTFARAAAGPGQAALPLPGLDGGTPASIIWNPSRPGRGQAVLMLPALLGSLLFCGFAGLLVAARDRVDRAISESEARFRDISQAASDWIWETDAALRLTFVSEACHRSLGITPASLVGRQLRELLLPLGSAPLPEASIAALAARGPFHNAVFRCHAGSGEPRVLRVAGKALSEGEQIVGYRGIATDITAEVAALEQARFLAHHDALTGLPNRVLMNERLREIVARSRRHGTRAAVLCLDLDGFKEVNDSMGHSSGDLLLARCAERLRACLRGSDSVARQGGDEFTVLQTDVDGLADIEGLCQRIVTVLAEPFDLDGREAHVTVSIGVAVAPADGHDPAQLLQRADMALYRAKNGGRNRFCFFEAGMDRQLRLRRQAEAELRLALVEGQLQVCYQPQVDCVTGALVGVEALVRWHHPERGMLLPGEFLPLAEETGIIHALGVWVLRTACRDAAHWSGLSVAVNVSPVQFRQRDFAATVVEALADAALPPQRLELEVTEGLLVHDNGDAVAMLAEIKALGVRITMDDFGTGYSSLAYLQRFPFDKIKIDRSFVSQLGGRPNTRAIVRAMVQLGRSLAVPICAEGVETEGQLTQLRDEGCQVAQGFLFARPVPADDVITMMVEWPKPQVPPRRLRAVADRGRRPSESAA